MKKITLQALLFCFGLSCNNNSTTTNKTENTFGEEFKPTVALTVDQLIEKMQSGKPVNAYLEGEVTSVCQVKGCWMTLKNNNGDDIRVTFKDYSFFVPKDCKGKKAIMKGAASVDTTSVEQLRHYAEDDGQSPEDIAKITEPKIEISFEASGVILK